MKGGWSERVSSFVKMFGGFDKEITTKDGVRMREGTDITYNEVLGSETIDLSNVDNIIRDGQQKVEYIVSPQDIQAERDREEEQIRKDEELIQKGYLALGVKQPFDLDSITVEGEVDRNSVQVSGVLKWDK